MRPFLEDAGFTNIHDRMFKLPLGTWPRDPTQKKLGAYFQLVADTGFEAYAMALFTRELGMSKEEVHELINHAKKESRDRRYHSYAKQ